MKKLPLKRILPALGVLALLVGAGVWVNSSIIQPRADEEAALRLADRLGVPYRPEQMALDQVPEDQNAEALLESKVKTVETRLKQLNEAVLPISRQVDGGAPVPPELNNRLVPFQDLIDLAHQMANRPFCHLERDWSTGVNTTFPEYAILKSFVRVLCLRAVAYAEKGDLAKAKSELVAAAHLANHAGRERFLIGHLVCLAGQSLVTDSLARILSLDATNPANQTLVRDVVKELQAPSVYEAFYGEAFLSNYTAILMADKGQNPEGESPSGIPQPGLSRRAATAVHRFWNTVLPVAKDHQNDIDMLESKLEEAVKAARKEIGTTRESPLQILEGYDAVFDAYRSAQARKNLLLTACQFLDPSVKAIEPLPDPFSKGNCIVLPSETEPTFYSFGRNRADDNASVTDPTPRTRTLRAVDLVLRLSPHHGRFQGT